MSLSVWWIVLAYYGLAVVSATIPWINAEVLMISAVPLADNRTALAVLIGAVSAGQMTGKAAMFWASRTSARPLGPALQGAVDRWRVRAQRRPRSVLLLVFLSALVGIPPFFIVSIVAGGLGMSFRHFLIVGATGRVAHFTLVACAPGLLWRMS